MTGEPAGPEGSGDLLRHYSQIRDELSRWVCCPHTGADLAQDAYFLALRYLQRRELPRNSLAWLRSIASNVMRSYFRRRQLLRIEQLCGDADVVDREESSELEEDSTGVDAAELAKAIYALPPISRALILGFYFEGKACDALGIELGISRGNVKVRLHRARRKLRKHLGHNEQVHRD